MWQGAPASDAGPEQYFMTFGAHTELPKVYASGKVHFFKTCIVIDVKSQASFGLNYIVRLVSDCNLVHSGTKPGY
jgi:hypothetical protein